MIDGAVILPPPTIDASADVAAATDQAWASLGSPRRLTVLVNDPQRHTDSRGVLSALAKHVAPSGLRVLVASGSHSFTALARQAFERPLLEGLAVGQVAWHDSRDGDLRAIGDGPAAWLGHPWLIEDRPVLAVGSVEPHYFAGFSGAHKTATIGCAAYGAIQSNHRLALSPLCQPGRLEGNPVHEGVADMLRALEVRRQVAAVNLVHRGRQTLAVSGGRVMPSLQSLLPCVRQAFFHMIDAPADALVAHVEGPLGVSFYQADKGIKNSESAVRDAGCIVLLAECPDGVGQDAFTDLLARAASCAEAEKLVQQRGYRLGDHKAVRLRRLTDATCRAVRVYVVSSGLSAEACELMGLRKAPDAAWALADAGIDARRDRVFVLGDAGNMCLSLSAPA